MSATNRGSERKPNDLYETPEMVTRDFLFNHFDGRFLRERYPNAHITGVDIKPFPCHQNVDTLVVADFLDYRTKLDFDLVFTNPPYSLAQEIISHAMRYWPKATIAMLLRIGFLESKKRYLWWQDRLPTELHVLANRPSFTGRGNDATAYAWFVWRPGIKEQRLNVIWGR